ncbi:MAG: type I-MYXAN CRISPR-associated protein Cas6/Cmx6 [Granulosicoccus sp.]|nr:type I-MYXAN CRISPR-associated protein Cas6/Cmx6 [Granulosicoccus sp.]
MLWQESTDSDRFTVPDTVVDMSFRFHCGSASNAIPVDHGVLLRDQISHLLPWITQEAGVAIHRIYGAATGNGWVRPENGDGMTMEVSKRTRLVIRLPKHRLDDARLLEQRAFRLGDQQIEVGTANLKPLVATRTLFCRSLISDEVNEEEAFTQQLVESLRALDIPISKLLCGKRHQIQTDVGLVFARSVMLAELSLEDAVKLQQEGLGEHQLLGCGIFLPHKDIAAVGSSQEESY